ncbi:MAG: hypothetical protein HYW78_03885 [Parcubacteria group bacterium]|nr:hypothetical protein [Parcubacteria group bacterium]
MNYNQARDGNQDENQERTRIVSVVLWSVFSLLLLINGCYMFSYNSSDEITMKQAFWTGKLTPYYTNQIIPQLFGDLWRVKKETSVKFSNNEEGKEQNVTTKAILVRFNDGGMAYMEGSSRFRFPADNRIFNVFRFFPTQDEVTKELLIPGSREICTATASLMSTEESYTTKRSMIADWSFDQSRSGVYFTEIKYAKTVDEFGQEKTAPVYMIKTDPETKEILRKKPIFGQFGLLTTLFTITKIKYLGEIDTQINDKMKYKQDLQITNQTIQTNEQYLNEFEATGIKNVTVEEMARRKDLEQVVQEKYGWREAQLLKVRTDSINTINLLQATKYETDAAIKEAEGEASRRRSELKGDNALNKRIDVYNEILSAYCEAIAGRSENAPEIASGWDPLYFVNLLNSIDAQLRKDLGLDFNFSKIKVSQGSVPVSTDASPATGQKE